MSNITRPKDPLSWLWLAIAAPLLPFFALGYRTIAIAAWFAPVFLVRFTIGIVPTVQTPYGKLAMVICYD